MGPTGGGRKPRADSRLFAGVGNGPVVGASLALYPLLTLVTCVAIDVLDGIGDLLFMMAFIGVGLPLVGILAVAATVMGSSPAGSAACSCSCLAASSSAGSCRSPSAWPSCFRRSAAASTSRRVIRPTTHHAFAAHGLEAARSRTPLHPHMPVPASSAPRARHVIPWRWLQAPRSRAPAPALATR